MFSNAVCMERIEYAKEKSCCSKWGFVRTHWTSERFRRRNNKRDEWYREKNTQSSPWDMWISPKLFLDQLNAEQNLSPLRTNHRLFYPLWLLVGVCSGNIFFLAIFTQRNSWREGFFGRAPHLFLPGKTRVNWIVSYLIWFLLSKADI